MVQRQSLYRKRLKNQKLHWDFTWSVNMKNTVNKPRLSILQGLCGRSEAEMLQFVPKNCKQEVAYSILTDLLILEQVSGRTIQLLIWSASGRFKVAVVEGFMDSIHGGRIERNSIWNWRRKLISWQLFCFSLHFCSCRCRSQDSRWWSFLQIVLEIRSCTRVHTETETI